MLTIDTKLRPAGRKGIGVFTLVDVEIGDVVWVCDEFLHKVYTGEEFEKMDDRTRLFVQTYGTFSPEDGTWFVDVDNTRFINHSDNPNLAFVKGEGVALRMIKAGEELTCDYRNLSPANYKLDFENLE